MKNTFQISLKLIMIFATGMTKEPPKGFDPKPSVIYFTMIYHMPRQTLVATRSALLSSSKIMRILPTMSLMT